MKTFREEDIQMEEEMIEKQMNDVGENGINKDPKKANMGFNQTNLRPNS